MTKCNSASVGPILAFLCFFAAGCAAPDRPAVSFDATPDVLSPRLARLGTTLEPLAPRQRAEAQRIVTSALAKYPARALGGIDRVVVVHDLAFRGVSAGGTWSYDRVYVVGRDPTFLERALHHELSSVLLARWPYLLDRDAWEALLPKEGHGEGGFSAIQSGVASKDLDPRHMKDGFKSQYARSSFENDFNEICEELFLGNPEFWDGVDRFPRFRAKVRLAIAFFRALDPEMDEAWFRSVLPSA